MQSPMALPSGSPAIMAMDEPHTIRLSAVAPFPSGAIRTAKGASHAYPRNHQHVEVFGNPGQQVACNVGQEPDGDEFRCIENEGGEGEADDR